MVSSCGWCDGSGECSALGIACNHQCNLYTKARHLMSRTGSMVGTQVVILVHFAGLQRLRLLVVVATTGLVTGQAHGALWATVTSAVKPLSDRCCQCHLH